MKRARSTVARHVAAAACALALVPAPDFSLELSQRLINLGKEDRPAKAFRSIDEARAWLAAQPEVV